MAFQKWSHVRCICVLVFVSCSRVALGQSSDAVAMDSHAVSSKCRSLLQTKRVRSPLLVQFSSRSDEKKSQVKERGTTSNASFDEESQKNATRASMSRNGHDFRGAARNRSVFGAAFISVRRSVINRTAANSKTESVRDASRQGSSKHKEHRSGRDIPYYAFGNFPKAESTFDPDGIGDHPRYPEYIASRVRDYGDTINMAAQEPPDWFGEEAIPAEWFEESKSGGPHAAWRTRFPQLEAYQNLGLKTIPWLPDNQGRHKQTYLPAAATSIARLMDLSKQKDAVWFDEAVSNYDEFGRNKPPTARSDRFYWDWKEQTWSTDIGCKEPGCVANVSLQTFDSTAFEHTNCKLAFGVHATDYDDEYSREYVDWLYVNEFRAVKHCDPMAKGCHVNAKVEDRGLHSCVADFPVDHLLNESTTLKLAGKISEMVDECPVNDNLFSGVVRVTCLLRPRPSEETVDVEEEEFNVSQLECGNATEIRCHERGCVASNYVRPCKLPKENSTQKCFLNLSIWQTDFDGDHGSVEVVEWVNVSGEQVATDVKPGRNPCKEVMLEGKAPVDNELDSMNTEDEIDLEDSARIMLSGVPGEEYHLTSCRRRLTLMNNSALHAWQSQEDDLPAHRRRGPLPYQNYNHLRAAPDEMYEIIKSKDVTDLIKRDGGVFIEGKISKMVDECGKDGYLFSALANVECK